MKKFKIIWKDKKLENGSIRALNKLHAQQLIRLRENKEVDDFELEEVEKK